MNRDKLNNAIKELELSLKTELRMRNPNDVSNLALNDVLSCLTEVAKEESKEIRERDAKIEKLEKKIEELETKYSSLLSQLTENKQL